MTLPELPPGLLARNDGNGKAEQRAIPEGPILSGSRYDSLWRLGRSMHAKGASEASIRQALHAENSERCTPPHPPEEVERIIGNVLRSKDKPDFSPGTTVSAPRRLVESGDTEPEFIDLATVAAEQVDYLIEPYLARGHLCLLVGHPEVGKTWLAMAWAKMVTEEGGNVLLIANENHMSKVLAARWALFNPRGPGKLLALPNSSAHLLMLNEGGLANLEKAIKKHGADLVVIDPIVRYSTGNLNRDNEVRQVLGPLGEIAADLDLAMLVNHHLTKDGGKGFASRVRGSGDFLGAADILLAAGRDEVSGERALFMVKNRISEEKPSPQGYAIGEGGLTFTGVSDLTPTQVLTEGGADQVAQAKAIILDALSDGESHRQTDIEAACTNEGLSGRSIRFAMARLKAEGTITFAGRDGPRGSFLVRLSSQGWVESGQGEAA